MSDKPTAQLQRATWHLWAIGGLAILWNGFGILSWAGTSFMPDLFLAGLPADHRDYVRGLPLWSTLTWGLGVLGGALGSILLMLRNPLAVPALGASLLGAVANSMVYFTHPAPTGFFNLPLTLFIVGFAGFLFWFALLAQRRDVP